MKQKPGYFKNELKKALRENKQPLNEQFTNCGDTNATNFNPNAFIGSVSDCTYDDNVMVHIFHMFQVSNSDPMDSGMPNTGPNNYNNYVEGAFFPSGQQGSVANQNLYEEIGSPPPGTWISNAVPGGQSINFGRCFQYVGEFSINDISLGGWAGAPWMDSWGIPMYGNNNLINQAVTTNLTDNPQDYFWSDSIEECWNEAFEETLGCTDPTAGNYDPYANTDDGSCIPIIEGCTNEEADNFNPEANTDDGSCIISGCTDPTSFNYDETANTDDGSCIEVIEGCTDSTAFNYDETANTDDGSCIDGVEGCTDSTAFNYNELANIDDGSCIPIVEGCTNPEAFNYDETANTDDGSCIEIVEGCTDPEAFNYDETANTDDGSCIEVILGCTNPESLNYDETANTDDGSCIPIIEGCTDPESLNYDEDANIDDGSCIPIIEGCTELGSFNYNPEANVDDGSCVDTVKGCTDPNAVNFDDTANVDDGSCYYNPGCTDPDAFNYDETFDFDDGSCEYEGCMGETAVNYNPNATIDDGSCEYNCSCTCGDLNGDGVMDDNDYNMQKDYILGNISFDEIPCPQNIITTNNGPSLDGSLVVFQYIMNNNLSDSDMMQLNFCYNNQTFGETNPGGGPLEFLDTIMMSEWLPEFYSAIEASGCYDLNVYGDDGEDEDDDDDIDGDDEQIFSCPSPENFEEFITSQEVEDTIPFAITIPSAEAFCQRCNNEDDPSFSLWMINFGPENIEEFGFTPPLGYDDLPIVAPYCTCCPTWGEEIEEEDIEGCIDSNASNYNSEANVDDGSCEYNQCERLEDFNEFVYGVDFGPFSEDNNFENLYSTFNPLTMAHYICHIYSAQVINGNTIDYNLDDITQNNFCCDQMGFVYNPENIGMGNKQKPEIKPSMPKQLPNMYNKQPKLNENLIKRFKKLAGL